MKKLIAVILCLVISASTMMCGCDLLKTEETLATLGTNVGIPLDPTDLTEIVQDIVTPIVPNEFKNDGNYMYEADNLNIKPKHLYWEGDKLVAECFVTNGKPTTAYNINVERLAFGNDEVGIFAEGSFGVIDGLTVPAYGYTVWTFTFSGNAIKTAGASLGYLEWQSSVSYRN